ncbi:MAG: hypothetical protein JSW14_08140 [Candidatus Bathyarchaeum sp.]|nr:MAG: hypothetical protein JSW14_08140 [Candidatus Bathyarchaeum sp.]
MDENSVSPTVKEDADNSYFYLTYQHSRKTEKLIGTNVIPEFPLWIILPLFLIATLFGSVIKKKILHST